MLPDPEDQGWVDALRQELEERGRVELHYSQQKLAGSLLVIPIAIGLVLVVTLLDFDSPHPFPDSWVPVLAWILIPLLVITGVVLAVSLLTLGPVVVVDDTGVHTCQRPRLSLRWDEIHDVDRWRMSAMGVTLRTAPGRVRRWRDGRLAADRFLTHFNRTRISGGLFVLPRLLDCPPEPLITWLNTEVEARRAAQ